MCVVVCSAGRAAGSGVQWGGGAGKGKCRKGKAAGRVRQRVQVAKSEACVKGKGNMLYKPGGEGD